MTNDQRLRKIARRGRDDLFFFCKEILGYDRAAKKPHGELAKFLNNSKTKKKLILMPRGSYKSSIVTIGKCVQDLVKNPNETILIASETQRKAIKFVKEIKGQIEQNPKFKALYGDWVNKGNTWKENEFIIAPRNKVKKEPSVMAGSLEKGALTGFHFSKIYLDDVVSISNINSPEQIEKTIDYYKLLLSILNPDGEIYICGTRWGAWELYSWILDKENPEHENFDIFHRPAEDEDGNLTMPHILSREFLDDIRATQGEYIYNCQYLNKVVNSDLSTFKQEHIQLYTDPPKGLIYFMSVDPAISVKERSDYSGVIVVGVDYEHNWWVEEALNLKVEPNDLMEEIFKLNAKYEPMMCLGMEKFALEKVLKVNLTLEMDKRNTFIPITDIGTDTRISKEARIRALQPRFENKQIFIKKGLDALTHQIVQHPAGKHDDLIDCLKNFLQITFPSDYKSDDEKPVKCLDHLSPKEQAIWRGVDKLANRKKIKRKDFEWL